MKLLSFLILSSTSIAAFANTASPKIYVDFETMSIYSRGVYAPDSSMGHAVDPVVAEVSARQNGLDHIQNYFENSCSKEIQKALKIKTNFNRAFRSQGTEIYSNGALEVNLKASYDDVIKSKGSSKVRTANGEKIVFALPSNVPADSLLCGIPAFEFKNDVNQNLKIQIIPAKTTKSLSENEKVVKLKFDSKKKVLVLANPNDAELIKTIQIKYNNEGDTYLPVTVYAQ